MFDYNGCTKCGAQWPERMGLECRVCEKPTKGTTMKADDVYAKIADNIKADNSVKQQAVARAIKRVTDCLIKEKSLGPHAFKAADIGCEDLAEVAAALRIDGFKAEVFGKPGARGPYELRVSVPVPDAEAPSE